MCSRDSYYLFTFYFWILPQPVKKKREGERRITQEDMLLEAAQTGVFLDDIVDYVYWSERIVCPKLVVHIAEFGELFST